MGIGILIFGKSGSGKSTSLRNFKSDDVGIINVISKPLPFKNVNNLKTIDTDNYEDVRKILTKSKAKSIVIDDAGYLLTNQFMRKHSNAGGGNAVDPADHRPRREDPGRVQPRAGGRIPPDRLRKPRAQERGLRQRQGRCRRHRRGA